MICPYTLMRRLLRYITILLLGHALMLPPLLHYREFLPAQLQQPFANAFVEPIVIAPGTYLWEAVQGLLIYFFRVAGWELRTPLNAGALVVYVIWVGTLLALRWLTQELPLAIPVKLWRRFAACLVDFALVIPPIFALGILSM
jgi:hypothetical protein